MDINWLEAFTFFYIALVIVAMWLQHMRDRRITKEKAILLAKQEAEARQARMAEYRPYEPSTPKRSPIYEPMTLGFFVFFLIPAGLILHLIFRLFGIV